MSDREVDETNADERSDARRPSRFRELASRLDDEAERRESAAESGAEPGVDDRADAAGDASDERAGTTGDASDDRDPTLSDVEPELSRRTDGDRADAEDETQSSDSWEWVDTGDGEAAGGTKGSTEPDATESEPTATDGTGTTSDEARRESPEASAVDSTAAAETNDTESASDRSEREASGRRERKERIWDSGASSTETPADSSSDGGPAGGVDAASSTGRGIADASTEPVADEPDHGVDPSPGTTILVESGSRDDRTRTTCQRLLCDDLDRSEPSVLLVRYQRMDPEELRRIATEAARTKLVTVGYAQDVPASLDGVETVKINNPNDITRLGIVVSGTINEWSDADGAISFCYDSINVLLNYRDVKRTFRFLHVLLRTLRRGDAVAHFHVDPLAGDPQEINTLKPLFDEVVSIDSTGMTVE
jgi:hypothetical protein